MHFINAMTKDPVNINDLVLWKIHELLEPNPVVYTRLGAVNKAFRRIFTSDKAWEKLNPYGVEEGIFNSLHDACGGRKSDYNLIRVYWSRKHSSGYVDELKKITSNAFVWLAHIVFARDCEYTTGFYPYRSLIESALKVYPTWYMWVCDQVRFDRSYVEFIAKVDPKQLENAHPSLWPDREIAKIAIVNSKHYPALQLATQWCSDPEIVDLAVRANPGNLRYVDIDFMERAAARVPSMVAFYINQCPLLLTCNENYGKDRRLVLNALSAQPIPSELGFFALAYASKKLQDDETLAMAAINSNPGNYHYVSDRLAKNKDLVLRAVDSWTGQVTKSVALSVIYKRIGALRDDRDVALAFVKAQGSMISGFPKYFSERDVVLAAKQSNDELMLLAPRLMQDKKFVLAQIENDSSVYRFLNDKLQNDRDILRELAKKELCNRWLGGPYDSFPLEKLDYGLMKAIVHVDAGTLRIAPKALRDNKGLVLAAVRRRSSAILYASARLQRDKDVIAAAFGTLNPSDGFEQLYPGICDDEAMYYPHIVKFGCYKTSLMEDRHVALLAIRANSDSFYDVPSRYTQDKEFVKEAVKLNPRVFFSLPFEFRSDLDVQASLGPWRDDYSEESQAIKF